MSAPSCPCCGSPHASLPNDGQVHVPGCGPCVQWEARILIGRATWGPWGPVPEPRDAWPLSQRADVDLRRTPSDWRMPLTKGLTRPIEGEP